MKWSKNQQRLYRAQVKELEQRLGVDDAGRRDILERVTGKRSTKGVDRDGMKQVIDEQNRLLRQGGAEPLTQRSETHPRWSQEEYIARLEQDLNWDRNPERLAGFIKRLTNGWKDSVTKLTTRQRTKLINAMKALKRSQAEGKAKSERPQGKRKCGGRWKPPFMRIDDDGNVHRE